MKKRFVVRSLCLAMVCFIVAGPTASAQQRVSATPVFRLRKFEINSRNSPKTNDDSISNPEKVQKWLQAYCEYEVTAKEGWLDNITFRWSMLLLGSETPRLVFTKSITYDKIQADGRETQRSVVYLSPRDIRRYYDKTNKAISDSKVVIYVEILSDGIKVGEFQYPGRPIHGVPPRWWESPQVNRYPGILLSRTESPWFNIDYDSWVPERPSEKPVAK